MKEAKALEVILIRLLLTSVCVLNTVSEEFIGNPVILRGERTNQYSHNFQECDACVQVCGAQIHPDRYLLSGLTPKYGTN